MKSVGDSLPFDEETDTPARAARRGREELSYSHGVGLPAGALPGAPRSLAEIPPAFRKPLKPPSRARKPGE